MPKPTFVYIFFLLFYLLPCISIHGQDKEILLSPDKNFEFNKNCWSVFASEHNNISLDSISQLYSEQKFKLVNEAVFNGGIPGKYFWFHFKIKNQQKQDISFYIDLRSPRLNLITLYAIQNGIVKKEIQTGDFLPFAHRPSDYKNFAFPYRLGSADSSDFFLFVNQVGNTFYLPVVISPAQNFNHAVFRNYFINGLTLGTLLFVAVLSLFFFINTRFLIYLYYFFFICSSILWVLSYFGLGFQYFWPDHPHINSLAAPLMSSLNILLTLQICQVLLQIKKRSKKLFITINICKTALACSGLFPVFVNIDSFGYTFNHIYLLVFLTFILSGLFIVGYSVLLYTVRGSYAAGFYLTASIFKLLGILNLALIELGITPALFNLEIILLSGAIIEILLLSYALAKKYTELKMNTYNAVIEARETERQRLAQEVHDNISNTLAGIKFRFYYIMQQLQKEEQSNGLDKEFADMYNIISAVQADVRNISHNLIPENIQHKTLSELVATYINDVSKLNDMNVEPLNTPVIRFSTNEKKSVFPSDITLQVFRIIQELIINVIKHAKASKAELSLMYDKHFLKIILTDDGIGMENDQAHEGIGIKNIRSRVELLNGNIDIKAAEAFEGAGDEVTPGTMITILVPYKRNRTDKQINY